MIRFQNVSFRYTSSSSFAIRDIDLEIGDGEYVLVAGPSGCGKSTLLRCMNGLVPHFYGGTFSGRVMVDGHDTRSVRVRNLSEVVGLVFQDPENQFVTTSVASEIRFGQENLGRPPEEIDERTAELGRSFGLGTIMERPPSEISGGEKQKAIIASVVAMGTKVLALDEPTSQLDPGSASQILQLLADFNRRGMTIVLAEHRLKRVMEDASRALVMKAGRIVFDGRPAEIPERFPQLVFIRAREQGSPRAGGSVKIKVRNLSFRYPESNAWALRDVCLDIRGSELLCIVGPNGSGKSTLALIMAGLLKAYQGDVALDGEELRSMPTSSICRKVGIVFQDPNIHLFHDDVRSEVEFARRNMGLQVGEETDRLLKQMGLTEVASRNPRDLSGGQREKVAIASVMSYQPQVLLLDEPTRGLDLAEKVGIMHALRQLTAQARLAVVVLTHDLEIVEGFADRVAVILDGKIAFEGDPSEGVARFLELMA